MALNNQESPIDASPTGDDQDKKKTSAAIPPPPNLAPPPARTIPAPVNPATIAAGLAKPIADGTAVSFGGKPLGYGSMVNGVPTFSDGKNSSSVPATMSGSQINALGSKPTALPAAGATSPITGISSNTATVPDRSQNSLPGALPVITPAPTVPVITPATAAFSAPPKPIANPTPQPSGLGPKPMGMLPAQNLDASTIPAREIASPPGNPYTSDPDFKQYMPQKPTQTLIGRIGDAVATNKAANDYAANPVGPPTLLQPPPVATGGNPAVTVNPTLQQLSNNGVLRPTSGLFSADNPQPLVNAAGGITDTTGARYDGTGAQIPGSGFAKPVAASDSTAATALPTSAGTKPVQAVDIGTKPVGVASIDTAIQRPVADTSLNASQSRFLAANGVPLDQQNQVAVGGDGTADNAAQVRRSIIQAGVTPGQNVRLGYDATSHIYGTNSKPGGRIDTFTGVGRPDPNNPTTKIDGAGAVAQQQVGVGLTPEQSAMAQQQQNFAAIPRITADPLAAAQHQQYLAQKNAASDAASIANMDPRSPLGMAARNLQRAASDTSTGTRAERAAKYQAGLAGLYGASQMGQKSASDLADLSVKDAGESGRAAAAQTGETQRSRITAAATIAGHQISRPTPKEIPLADGTLALLNQDGSIRPAIGADGQPVRPQIGKPQEDVASVNKIVNERANTLLGVDPLTGLIPSGEKGKPGRPPTAQEYQRATAAAYESMKQKAADGAAGATAKPTKDQFMTKARAANPGVSDADLAKYYSTTYGT